MGILGNLAKKVIDRVPLDGGRAILWWIQQKSWEADGLEGLAGKIHSALNPEELVAFPERLNERGQWDIDNLWHRLDRETGPNPFGDGSTHEFDPERTADLLREFCTNPCAISSDKWSNRWQGIRPILERMRSQEMAEARSEVAETAVASTVWRALDRVRKTGTHVLLYGPPAIGKGTCAKAWCRSTAGRARFVETPPGNDIGALVKAVAKALGTASATTLKTPQVEERVLATLGGSDLILVFDKAERLWPRGDIRQSAPRRLDWLLSIMDGAGRIPVALISNEQWVASMEYFRGTSETIVRQFEGLLSGFVNVPGVFNETDLMKIASIHVPAAGDKALRGLVNLALSSTRGLSGMMEAIREATALALSEGRSTPVASDFAKAFREALRAEEDLADLRKSGKELGAVSSGPEDLPPPPPSARDVAPGRVPSGTSVPAGSYRSSFGRNCIPLSPIPEGAQ